MTLPLSQLSFREPEPGLWICKKEMVFSLDKGNGVFVVKVGQPVVVVDFRRRGHEIAWKLVMPDGSMCWCEWQFQINGRWSKKFALETG